MYNAYPYFSLKNFGKKVCIIYSKYSKIQVMLLSHLLREPAPFHPSHTAPPLSELLYRLIIF